MRKYDEIKTDVLMDKILSTPAMRKFVPEFPRSHKIDKTYLASVFFGGIERFRWYIRWIQAG